MKYIVKILLILYKLESEAIIFRSEILSRHEALNRIWKSDSYFNARCMDLYISKLRSHLKEDNSIEIINIHGEDFKIIY